MKSVVIVGCPFSGTRHVTEVLRSCGVNVGHEKVEPQGIVSWKHTKWSRDDFIREGVQEPIVILHQAKHPIMAIPAILANLSPGDWRWLGDHAETHDFPHLMRDRSPLERSMGLWYYWNKMAEKMADHTYAIERLSDRWQWFLQVTGQPWMTRYPRIDKRINRHKARVILTWGQMYNFNPALTSVILSMAYRYGYTESPVDYLSDPFYDISEDIGLPDRDFVEHVERMIELNAGGEIA